MLTPEQLRLGILAFHMEASAIERDARLSELTDDEIKSIVHGILAVTILEPLP